ncbi:MAG: DNA polymerase III subunit beta [Candidatus Pacebacteria bacterium]|nr:DNA polymerase III subunit beta [Candidatus Paceibacterota bacterium]
MKLTVLQENLNKGLLVAARTVASRPQLPVLTHVLLAADKGRLRIASTNLETGINLWVGAKIEEEGSITIPARILSEFVSSLPSDKVVLQTKENLLNLISGRFRASFNGLSASEFPKIASTQGRPILTIESETLTKAVSQVAFAAAADETRPALTGVFFFPKGENLNLVATDGYRLSLKTLTSSLTPEAKEKLTKGIVVPARAFSEVARIAGDEEGKVKFYFMPESSQLIFMINQIEVVTRLIEADFPEFEKIIPVEGKIKAEIETQDFIRVIKMAAIFARESANIIRFSLGKSGVEVSANTAQVGENKSLVEVKVEGGEDKIAFNSRYLLDFLSAVRDESFTLTINGPLSPGVFKPLKDNSFLHVIMPVRVQE